MLKTWVHSSPQCQSHPRFIHTFPFIFVTPVADSKESGAHYLQYVYIFVQFPYVEPISHCWTTASLTASSLSSKPAVASKCIGEVKMQRVALPLQNDFHVCWRGRDFKRARVERISGKTGGHLLTSLIKTHMTLDKNKWKNPKHVWVRFGELVDGLELRRSWHVHYIRKGKCLMDLGPWKLSVDLDECTLTTVVRMATRCWKVNEQCLSSNRENQLSAETFLIESM